MLGPGLITGAADDDPSGIATCSQTGAVSGYGQLWTAHFSFPFMIVVKRMCGRIGLVTGKGLARGFAGAILDHYSKRVLSVAVALLVAANTINIGADLGAMASSAEMLLGIPYLFRLALITVSIVLLEVFVPCRTHARIVKYLALMLSAHIVTAFLIGIDWTAVTVGTVLPHLRFSTDYLLTFVAILGTTISPYLFFWQASEEVEEEIVNGRIPDMGDGTPTVTAQDIVDLDRDTVIGMCFSQLILFFIIVTMAATLHLGGSGTIETEAQAAGTQRPLADDLAYGLFAAGIVGTGLLAVPILAGSSAYAVAETIGWREGLSNKARQAPGSYTVLSASTLIGMTLDWFGIDPFRVLYYPAALNGLAAPPIMALAIMIASRSDNKAPFVNSRASSVLGRTSVIVMAIAGGAFIVDLVIP
jgi:NRAMP (natural resistance-associated macrophage protein)-like metal ion transporter